MRYAKNNVTKTRELNMCVSCEICSAVCPLSAITMEFQDGKFVPSVNMELCTECGICLSVCPGINIDYNNTGSYRELVGPYIGVYTVHTKNEEIRKISTSGGFVTTLVAELLEKGEYDGAFLLTFDSFDGKPARLKLCSERQQVIRAAKSKYIPASAYNVIKELEKRNNKKYVIVGTPCLFQGIKQFLKNKNIPENNLLFIGLFCDKTLNYNIYDYFEKTYGKEKEKLIRLDFRTKDPNGWPGDCKLFFDSGRTLVVSRNIRGKLKDFFQLNRCLFCLDKLNTLADISVGDCYIKREADNRGKSSVIIRTEKGKRIFDKYSYLFDSKKERMSDIAGSQKIYEKRDNIANIKLFKDMYISIEKKQEKIKHRMMKELVKKQRRIYFGEKKKYFLMKLHIFFEKFFKITIPINLFINLFIRRPQEKNTKQNIVITGGNLRNKGAQAMIFTVVDFLKKTFPDKKIYVFAGKEEDRETYTFEVLPYDLLQKIKIFSKTNPYSPPHEIISILSKTDFVLDVSGYALGSQHNIFTNTNFLFNIMVARHFSLPCYYLPQSVGPFDYNPLLKMLFYPLLKIYLKYPKKFYVREKDGLKHIYKFTKKNVRHSNDIVLQNKKYSISNIYRKNFSLKTYDIKKNSVGIIPNQNVRKRTNEYQFYQLYRLLIEELLRYGKNVYLLPHSDEDFSICREIKKQFRKDDRVILLNDSLDCIELEKVIEQFDFIVASRYHSIIHAYRNGVPALIIGWATKYYELAEKFDQLSYLSDIRNLNTSEEVIDKLKKMLENYPVEKEKIVTALKHIQRKNIFNNLFED